MARRDKLVKERFEFGHKYFGNDPICYVTQTYRPIVVKVWALGLGDKDDLRAVNLFWHGSSNKEGSNSSYHCLSNNRSMFFFVEKHREIVRARCFEVMHLEQGLLVKIV